jgi:site-specific DNA recombinase
MSRSRKMNYFLYIRKSTDEDDRQVLSLEAQETELREFALRERLDISATFRESQTAKEPGRPVFNDMLARLERGEAQGILSWHPDRLARNSIDGGRIIYLIDTGKLLALKSPTFWFEPTPQGKFMLNIAFGQSKYFVDNLSENTKRGLRQKLRRGEWPGYAPLGYDNDLRTHTIVPDPERAPLVKKLFERYASGGYSLKGCRSIGLESRNGKPLSVSNIQTILSNPLYYGVFRYNGELHEGKHEPIITKKLFDAVQDVLHQKAHKVKRGQREYAFRGLLTCGECGCSITSETQKGHAYYRCTKKCIPCSQKFIREEALASLISTEIQKVSLSPIWADALLAELEKEERQTAQTSAAFSQNLKAQIGALDTKLDILLDAHLDGSVAKDEYAAKKRKLLDQKTELSEKVKDFERTGGDWLEPAKRFVLTARDAGLVAQTENLSVKRDFLKRIGSNRIFLNRAISVTPFSAWGLLADFHPPIARSAADSDFSRTMLHA